MKYFKLTRNSVTCLKCGDEIESKHRHDYVSCKCGAIAVDGGLEYARRVGNLQNCKDTSQSREFTLEEYQEKLAQLEDSSKRYSMGSYYELDCLGIKERIAELTQNKQM